MLSKWHTHCLGRVQCNYWHKEGYLSFVLAPGTSAVTASDLCKAQKAEECKFLFAADVGLDAGLSMATLVVYQRRLITSSLVVVRWFVRSAGFTGVPTSLRPTTRLLQNFKKFSRCNHPALHLEKLRNEAYAQKYAVTILNCFEVLRDQLIDLSSYFDSDAVGNRWRTRNNNISLFRVATRFRSWRTYV